MKRLGLRVKLLLIMGLVAGVAWAERVEMVTYYPTPAPTNFPDPVRMKRATVGTPYLNNPSVTDAKFQDGQLLVSNAVGIGTTAPIGLLNVQQSINSNDTTDPVALNIDSAVVNGASASLTASGNGSQTFVRIAPVINQKDKAGYTALLINATEDGTGTGSRNLLDLQVGGDSRMVVQSSGNVGIGTTNPGAPLHVTKKNATDVVAAFGASTLQTSGDEEVIIGQHNATGGGTPKADSLQFKVRHDFNPDPNPANHREPQSAINWHFRTQDDKNQFRGAQVVAGRVPGTNTGALWFRTGDTKGQNDPMYIAASGNVGIGTTTPGSLLDVNGQIQELGQAIPALITGSYLGNGGTAAAAVPKRRTIPVSGISPTRRPRVLMIIKGKGGNPFITPMLIKTDTMPGTFHYLNGDKADYRGWDAAVQFEDTGFSIDRTSPNANEKDITYHWAVLTD